MKPVQKRPAPKCAKCPNNHYGFISCQKAEADKAAADRAAAEFRPVMPEFSRESGREWAGDRLYSYERTGNTLWRKRDG